MTEELPEQEAKEIRADTLARVKFAEKILSGDYGHEPPDEESQDPSEVFEGPILDLNDSGLSEQEKAYVEGWIEKQLGSTLEAALIKARLLSPDEQTAVEIYDKPLGNDKDSPWYLSKWQNEGEKPSYIFWPEETYQWQVEEAGFTEAEK